MISLKLMRLAQSLKLPVYTYADKTFRYVIGTEDGLALLADHSNASSPDVKARHIGFFTLFDHFDLKALAEQLWTPRSPEAQPEFYIEGFIDRSNGIWSYERVPADLSVYDDYRHGALDFDYLIPTPHERSKIKNEYLKNHPFIG